ncbi:hypothetical protein N9N67_12590 [Bacteriovoracaceae bacterium]|nr:hypothetical protein [Bacteriovoracaceae bacterium]
MGYEREGLSNQKQFNFACLVDQYQEKLFKYTLYLTDDYQRAEEYCLAAFVELLERLSNGHAEIETLKYLIKEVNKKVDRRMAYSQEATQSSVFKDRSQTNSLVAFNNDRNFYDLNCLFRNYSQIEKRVYMLKELFKLNYEEIALLVKLDTETLKKMHRELKIKLNNSEFLNKLSLPVPNFLRYGFLSNAKPTED